MATRDYGHHLIQTDLFPLAYRESLADAIRRSPLLGPNPLNHYFRTTRGYSVVCRRDGLAEVGERFPEFRPYLEKALSPMANAFYLNPLVIPGGGFVNRHADHSLRSYVVEAEHPMFVSVLYVHVPTGMQGGQLRLIAPDDRCLAEIVPEAGHLVTFQGDLRHEVTAVAGVTDDHPRISLVCEQYALSNDALAGIPRFTVQSTGGFGSFLAMQE